MSEEINPGDGGRTERRRYPRLNTSVQLKLVEGAAAPIYTKTDEIALGGCYIETMFTLPIGINLTIILWLDDTKLSTSGRVVTRFPQVGNGIEFADMSAEDKVQLSRFIAEHLPRQQASAAE
jgi:hypothetical protein